MHKKLRDVLNKTVELFAADPRFVAGWLSGSAGGSREDEHSDVDPIFLIRDEDFENIDSELPSVFEAICSKIVLWWPEIRDNPTLRNYAVLISEPELLQYDINLLKLSAFSPGWLAGAGPEQVLFDKTGVVRGALGKAEAQPYSADDLLWNVEKYWLYTYISAKYLRRRDVFKLLYAQGVLFQTHLAILQALCPNEPWGWWPSAMKRHTGEEKRTDMLLYFGAAEMQSITVAVQQEMDAFAKEARLACRKYGMPYPEELETLVRKHLVSLTSEGR